MSANLLAQATGAVSGGFRDGINPGEIGFGGCCRSCSWRLVRLRVATTAGADPVALAAKQTMRDIDNAEFATTPEQEAIALLQPQDMLLEEQIVDLQMRLRSLGQDKLASVYGSWLNRLDTMDPPKPNVSARKGRRRRAQSRWCCFP